MPLEFLAKQSAHRSYSLIIQKNIQTNSVKYLEKVLIGANLDDVRRIFTNDKDRFLKDLNKKMSIVRVPFVKYNDSEWNVANKIDSDRIFDLTKIMFDVFNPGYTNADGKTTLLTSARYGDVKLFKYIVQGTVHPQG